MEDFETFYQNLKARNKEACVTFCLEMLASGKIDIKDLYEGYLKEALDKMTCDSKEKDLSIWREHEATAIVRTIIECAYPYVIRERDKNKSKHLGKAVVLCPEGEYHEIGARMVSDFLTIFGFEAIYVGSNTPKEEIVKAIQILKLDLIALSITDYYNLVAARKMIDLIRSQSKKSIRILVGGKAFENNAGICNCINADNIIQNYEGIKDFLKTYKKVGDE